MLTDKQKIQIVKDYNSGKTMEKLAKINHVSRQAISGLLHRRGINTRKNTHCRKYTLDDTIFDIIDTEAKAYWIGFLLGDGTVNKYYLRLHLAKIDVNHIEKFKKFLGAKNKLYYSKKDGSPSLSIGSKSIVGKLAQYYIVPRKTYKEIGIPNIPSHLIRHFVRGFMDADGSIHHKIHKGKKKDRLKFTISFACYCKSFLKQLQKWIKSEYKFCGSIVENIKVQKNGKTYRVCQFAIGGNINFQNLYHLFYDDATVYLDRKKLLAEEAIQYLTSS